MIGYYVHHHGAGHGRRAAAVSGRLGDELVGLGSGGAPEGWAGATWIELARDDGEPGVEPTDPTRRGAWHWVPPDHAGFTARMRTIAAWIADTHPAAMVVDVSVEVTALVELLGTSVATVVLPGDRSDRPHRLALDTASLVVAPWTPPDPTGWCRAHGRRAVVTGGFGRFDGRSPAPPGHPGRVVALLGTGGSERLRRVIPAAVATTPPWDWHVAGAGEPVDGARGHGWVADPWPLLGSAAVVVTGCGGATLSEVAAARRPAVLVAEDRPFAEQHRAAEALRAAGAPVVVVPADDSAPAWPDLLAEASGLDGARWARTHDGHGADRFCAAVRTLVAGAAAPPLR